MSVRVGSLRHRVEFQSATKTNNDFGEAEDVWAAYAVRWVRIEPLTGRELLEAKQTQAQLTHRVTTHWDEALAAAKPFDRIAFGSRIFEIESVINDQELNREMIFMVQERYG